MQIERMFEVTEMSDQVTEKDKKQAENQKKKKKGSLDEDEPDMDALDWWSKYFASVETMIRVCMTSLPPCSPLLLEFSPFSRCLTPCMYDVTSAL
jgi:hypothetical protein